MSTETEILIDSVKKNSVRAFDALYRLYSGKLYHFVMKISNRDSYISEEIVQRVFIKIWEDRNGLDPQKSFNSFICTIAKNMLLNEYKHQMVKFVYQNYILISNQEESSESEDRIEYSFLMKYLDTLIEKLSPARKQAYIMSRFDRLTVKEIAEKTGKSEKTIEKQLSEANEFIRQQLLKHYDKIISLLVFSALVWQPDSGYFPNIFLSLRSLRKNNQHNQILSFLPSDCTVIPRLLALNTHFLSR